MKHDLKKCPLCGADAVCTYEQMTGYIEGTAFDIYECKDCNASFADPLLSPESIYNHIYRQVEHIPGYMRYHRFAELVKRVKNPLDVLSNLENTYWAIRESLRKEFGKRKDINILEIGSGLGYLTYSLNKAGYEAMGLDLSKEAVEKAKKRYGNFYEAGDLFVVAKLAGGRYDCVIMTELIEHVEDPKAFIVAALSLLKEGGKLIMTTPNKTKSYVGAIWQSDVPPVHLWWFAEKSFEKLAYALNKKCQFLDFTPYTTKFFEYGADASMEQIQASLPRLRANGDVAPEHKVSSLKSKLLGVRLHSLLAHIKMRLGQKNRSSRSSSMCVIITN
jgi:SAM-dependent methyltransferase